MERTTNLEDPKEECQVDIDLQENIKEEQKQSKRNYLRGRLKEVEPESDEEKNSDDDLICDKYFEIEQAYRCDQCNKRFTQSGNFWRHKAKKHGILSKVKLREAGNYQCDLCEETFTQSGNLRRHKSRRHGSVITFKCHFCNEEYKSVDERKEHQKRYTDGQLFTCPEENCNSTFKITARKGFQDHLYRHWGRFAYSCEHCGKLFTVKEWFVAHMESHTDPHIKPYACEECSMTYKTKMGLISHMNQHLNPEKFKCEICAKGFSEAGRLREHMLTHTQEKTFSCSHCNELFVRRQVLTVHIAKVHTGFKKYKCATCEKAFFESSRLRRHVRIHTGEMPYVCSKCGKGHNQTANKKKHEISCGGIKHLTS